MNQNGITQETLDLIKAQMRDGQFYDAEIAKAFTTGLGLVFYDLEPAAKILYPVITPLRNMLPRLPGRGGTSTHWKSITAINATRLSAGVSEGNRGGAIVTTLVDNLALYKTLGLEDYVTFEAELAAMNFDDAKARAVEGQLRALMISEEFTIVGGNATNGLPQTPTPTCVDVATGGALIHGHTYNVYCAALTLEGFVNATVALGIPQQVGRTNIDGTTDYYGGGAAKLSAIAATIVGAGDSTSVHALACSVLAVPGAVAYAWFCGDNASGAGACLLTAITNINSFLYTGNETQGTQTAASVSATVDYSTNALLFDGFLGIAAGATPIASLTAGTPVAGVSGSLLMPMATGTPGTGTPLTTDGAGGIVEIDAMLKAFWDNYRLAPTHMWVSGQEVKNITNKVIGGGGVPLFRFVTDTQAGTAQGRSMTAGGLVGSYLNRYTMTGGEMVKVQIHPNIPPGTILFDHETIPYPLSNISNVRCMRTMRDYYQIEWPIRKRQYEYGIYCNEVLQHYFPPALGILFNIANG